MKHLIILTLATILFVACGNGSTTPDINNTKADVNDTKPDLNNTLPDETGPLKIIGHISYEKINPKHINSTTTLDKSDITEHSVKEVLVEAIDASGKTLASTSTNSSGDYNLTNIPQSTDIKIRVYAKMLKASTWNVKVVDNTNHNSQYVLEGSLINSGTHSSKRDLKARYSNDSSAPFAILDSIYQAMKKVQTADKKVNFPELKVNWSVNNTPSGTFNLSLGLLPTTYYYDGNIYVLGDKASDSDEFDNHILIHEWGHYFEDILSRTDSIGGSHGTGEKLDIRVAFGEGFGNAFSAIATDDPIYFDTSSNGKTGWNMNVEKQEHDAPGYFSEASIQRILYDIYDKDNDGYDRLNMGFKPMYKVLVGAEKTTPAFTSIFTFIDALKSENPNESEKIDAITSSEDITPIDNIYGSNNNALLYLDVNVDETITLATSNQNGVLNKLYNNRYVKFTVEQEATYTIKLQSTSNNYPDPDFLLFQVKNFTQVGEGLDSGSNETKSFKLKKGAYLLDVTDANYRSLSTFKLTIN